MPEIVVAPLAMTTTDLFGTINNEANATTDRLGRAVNFPAIGNHTLQFDLGSVKSIDTFSLLAGDFTAGDTVRWSGANTSNAATYGPFVFDTGALTALASPEGANRVHRQHLHHLSAPVSVRYVTLHLSFDHANAYFGRAVIGDAFTPEEPRDYGWEMRVVDMGALDRTQTGLEDILIRAKVLELSWTWAGLTKEESENVALDLLAYAGTTRDVLVCLDTLAANRHNLIGFGKMAEPVNSVNYAEGWYEMKVRQLSKLALAL